MRTRLFPIAAVMLLAWGALAFGAEYSWAYAPLLVLSVAVGVLGLLASRASVGTLDGTTVLKPDATTASVTWAPGLVILAGLLQLVPLPQGAVAAISPASGAADYRQLYAEATMRASSTALSPQEGENEQAGGSGNGTRALSIEPSRTALGLAFLAAFALLLMGTARARFQSPTACSILRQ